MISEKTAPPAEIRSQYLDFTEKRVSVCWTFFFFSKKISGSASFEYLTKNKIKKFPVTAVVCRVACVVQVKATGEPLWFFSKGRGNSVAPLWTSGDRTPSPHLPLWFLVNIFPFWKLCKFSFLNENGTPAATHEPKTCCRKLESRPISIDKLGNA